MMKKKREDVLKNEVTNDEGPTETYAYEQQVSFSEKRPNLK